MCQSDVAAEDTQPFGSEARAGCSRLPPWVVGKDVLFQGWLRAPGSVAALKMFYAEQVIKYSKAVRGRGAVHGAASSQNEHLIFSSRPALLYLAS